MVKQLYNSHNDLIHVLWKMREVEVPEERLFCEIEDFNCFCGDIKNR